MRELLLQAMGQQGQGQQIDPQMLGMFGGQNMMPQMPQAGMQQPMLDPYGQQQTGLRQALMVGR